MRHLTVLTAAITTALLLTACGGGDPAASSTAADPGSTAAAASATNRATSDAQFARHLQDQLTNAKPGSVITIPAGHYHLRRGLVMNTDGVTIRGAGMDKTVLNFKGMVSGPQGLLVNANHFTIEDLAIEDTKGDGLKIKQGNHIVIRHVRVSWTRGPNPDNGGYALYPIRTNDLLVENSEASGASDSGLYVGQSKNVVVRDNKFTRNVAGIEIENTVDADVYNNVTTDNAGGILVFNMPNLMQLGKNVRVYKNHVFKNNYKNFGAKGTPVASLPSGSGIVVNSNDYVEIFDNHIADNKTANIIISSYYSTNYDNETGVNPDYNPYPKAIYIHDNHFSGGGTAPGTPEYMKLKVALFGKDGHFPDVMWDGFYDPKNVGKDGLPPRKDRICVPNTDVTVLNADAPNHFKHPNTDDQRFRCKLPSLPPVKLDMASHADPDHGEAS